MLNIFSLKKKKAQDVDKVTNLQPPFVVKSAGCINRECLHSTPGTKEQDVMLAVFLDGRGVYQNSKGVTEIAPGMVSLVPPDDCGVRYAVRENPYLEYHCRFNGDYALELGQQILKQAGKRFFFHPSAVSIAECIRKMARGVRQTSCSRMGKSEALLAVILTELLLEHDVCDEPGMISRASLEAWADDHISDRIDLEAAADWFGNSKNTVCRKSRELTGNTFLHLCEIAKVSRAELLLQLGALSVSDIAVRVGYKDPFYFSRVFRKHKGLSPKQWQKQDW